VVGRIVKAASNPAEVVLDPFAGSCSTGIAATGLGRVFVGFELREDYCEASVQRFKDFLVERKNAQKQTEPF
jgi:adenine-specific DNA-methyltransferase